MAMSGRSKASKMMAIAYLKATIVRLTFPKRARSKSLEADSATLAGEGTETRDAAAPALSHACFDGSGSTVVAHTTVLAHSF
jgi:hypothetical protein